MQETQMPNFTENTVLLIEYLGTGFRMIDNNPPCVNNFYLSIYIVFFV